MGASALGDAKGEFMAFNRADASSPLCPPERKAMPGTSTGTTRRKTRIVASATSAGVGWWGRRQPGQNHIGLQYHRF